MAKVVTKTDNFATLDTVFWSSRYGTTSVVSGQANTATTTAGSGLFSGTTWDLTASQITIKIVQVPAGATLFAFMQMQSTSTNYVEIGVFNSVMYGKKVVAGVTTSGNFTGTFSVSTHKYWRIREASSTTYFEYSADADSWTTGFSTASPSFLTADFIVIGSGGGTGSTFIFDDLNILPVVHSADATRPVTATMAAALGATTKPVNVASTVTATLASALGGTTKPVDAAATVTATLASALGGTAKPVAVTQTVTAAATAAATATKPAASTLAVSTTIAAAAEQFPGIKTDFATAADAVDSVNVTPTGDTGSAVDAAVTIAPDLEDTGDEQVFATESHTIAQSAADDDATGADDGSVVATLSSADTGSAIDAQEVPESDEEFPVADDDFAAADETSASVIVPITGSDTAALTDTGLADAELLSDDPAAAVSNQSVTILNATALDDASALDAEVVTAQVSDADTGTAVEDGGAEYPLDDADTGGFADGATPPDAALSHPDTGSAAEASSILVSDIVSGDTAHGVETSPAFTFMTDRYLVSSRQ